MSSDDANIDMKRIADAMEMLAKLAQPLASHINFLENECRFYNRLTEEQRIKIATLRCRVTKLTKKEKK